MNTAENPWGPWSEAQELYDPVNDEGYCDYIYAKECGCLNMTGMAAGIYAPFLIKSVKQEGGVDIYYDLSLWNPYEVALFKTTLKRME